VTKPNAHATITSFVIWILTVTATWVLWLDGHGRLSNQTASSLHVLFPFILVGVPGPMFVAMVLHANMFSSPKIAWASIFVGLCLDFFLYWLVIRLAISGILFIFRRHTREHSS
jgi:hypothetical protein